MAIDRFQGKYRFLSNFWPSPVVMGSVKFPTVENAYQASKLQWKSIEETIPVYVSIAAMKPNESKKVGRQIQKSGFANHRIVENWNDIKLTAMRFLLKQKFDIPELEKMLLDTGDEELIEGNTWGDTYWGVQVNGHGQNHLGKLLMAIRSEKLLTY